MNWATREAAKDLRKEQDAANAIEKSVREARLKDSRGMELFEQLHAWMERQAKSYNEQMQKRMIEVGEIKIFGGMDSHHYFQVSDASHARSPMKISYRAADHRITVECGAGQKQYTLTVGDNENVYYETPYHQLRTIEELGEELMSFWKGAQF